MTSSETPSVPGVSEGNGAGFPMPYECVDYSTLRPWDPNDLPCDSAEGDRLMQSGDQWMVLLRDPAERACITGFSLDDQGCLHIFIMAQVDTGSGRAFQAGLIFTPPNTVCNFIGSVAVHRYWVQPENYAESDEVLYLNIP